MPTIIHSLPLGIAYDGEAEVQKGFPFTSNTEADSQAKTSATFRGRRLAGMVHSVPEGLKFVHLKNDLDNDQVLTTSAVFDSKDVTLIEWTKEDLPERPKLALDSFSRLLSIQNQINSLFQ